VLLDVSSLQDALPTLPQPVALVTGRILRARYLGEQLDAILKAAEVLTRYVAMATLASFASRDDPGVSLPHLGLAGKDLAFGDFLRVPQAVSKLPAAHPLADRIRPAFAGSKKSPDGRANTALTSLLELRNAYGHGLRNLDEGKARGVASREKPDEALIEAFRALRPVLDLPLMVVEQQEIAKGAISARILFLMGEGFPMPQVHELAVPVHEPQAPYIAYRGGVLCLSPGLVWDFLERREEFGLLFCDKIRDDTVEFKAIVDDTTVARGPETRAALAGWLQGAMIPPEAVGLSDGRLVRDLWRGKRDPEPSEAVEETGGVVGESNVEEAVPTPLPDRGLTNSTEESRRRETRTTVGPDGLPTEVTLERVEAIAASGSVEEPFRRILKAGEVLGLYARPYKWSVMFTPPSHRNRMIMFLRPQITRNPYLTLNFRGPDLAAFVGVSLDRVRSTLGPGQRQIKSTDEADDFLRAVRKLVSGRGQ
jgi:hypothetical protein